MPKKIDLTGQRFGKLVVTGEAPIIIDEKGNRYRCWYCNCDCGKVNTIKKQVNLRSGKTNSCGCIGSENRIKNVTIKKIKVKYDLQSEDYGIGYDSSGNEFWFDKEDYELINKYNWHKENSGYIRAIIPMSNKKRILLHKLIMNDINNNLEIDHIDNQKFNCTKSNLRIVTKSQNSTNRKVSKNNTSGVTGVYYEKQTNRWIVRITKNNKCHYIGRFDNFEDAVKARKEAEDKYFGEWSYDNSQKIVN